MTRETAKLTDDGEILPPEVQTRRSQGRDPVRSDLVEAVEAALEKEPNTLNGPILWPAKTYKEDSPDHCVAYLSCNFNEIAKMDGDTPVWLPPYRAREEFEAALRPALPDDLEMGAQSEHVLVFYEE